MKAREIQRQVVLKWLEERGELTVFDAVGTLHILSLPKRIEELRKQGIQIVTDWRKSEYGSRYGVYRLEEEVTA